VSNQVFFGEFVLDPGAREVRRGSDAVALSPKAYQLLDILVAHRPKALSKIELQDRLWPDTFVVEKNLVNLIAEIRAALGDDPSHPRFVRTVPRFGYAFRETAAEPTGDRPPGSTSIPRFRLRWAEGRALLTDGTHVLGRDPDLDLFVDSPGVSRRHARITISGAAAIIEDLDSKNGTFVAGRCLEAPIQLKDGDVIRLGSVELSFYVMSARNSTRTEIRRKL
jgi:DNA-binding winged helix-turn-helix (wHTH) protein